MTAISDALVAYRTREGFVSNRPRKASDTFAPDSGNQILFTGLARYAGLIEPGEVKHLLDRVAFRGEHRGLLKRTPSNTFGQIAHDDLYAVAYLAASCPGSFVYALRYLHYCRKHFYVFNNRHPGRFTWKAFMGRYPWLTVAMKCAAYREEVLSISRLNIELFKAAQSFALRSYSQRGKNVEAATHFVMRNEAVLRGQYHESLTTYALEFGEKFLSLGGLGPVLRAWGRDWSKHPVTLKLLERGL